MKRAIFLLIIFLQVQNLWGHIIIPPTAPYDESSVAITGGSATLDTLKVKDTDQSHTLELDYTDNATSDYVLDFKVNGADRTVDLSGNFTVESDATINQDTTSDASPTFAGATLSGLNTANGVVQTDGSGVLSTTLTPSGLTSVSAGTFLGDILKVKDTDQSHTLELDYTDNATSDYVLDFKVNGADRTVDLSGNFTVESDATINQDTTTDASPTFSGATLSGLNTANGVVQTDGSGVLSTTLTPSGLTSVSATTFLGDIDSNVAAAGVTISGTTLAADGTDANINIAITPKGTGEVDISKVDIDSGTIDGVTIATSDVTVGAGKTLDASAGTLNLADDQISGDKVEGGTISAITIDTLTTYGTWTLIEDDLTTFVDMSVTATPSDGDDVGYIFKIDGNTILSVLADADGAGAADTFRLKLGANTPLVIAEQTTPTAIADHGSFYTKSDNLPYFQDGAGSEHVIKTAGSFYSGMYMYESAGTVTINEANTYHFITGFTTGLLGNWTFDAGSTGTVTAYADYSGTVAGTVLVTDAAHGLITGDDITLTNTTNYNGVYTITKVTDDTFYITDTWVVDDAQGTWTEGSYMQAGSGAAGVYSCSWGITGAAGAASKNYKFEIFINSTEQDGTAAEMTPSGTNRQNCAGFGNITIADGDRVYLGIMNKTDAANFNLEHSNIVLHRL